MTEHPGIPKTWEHFSHEADIGVRGFGATQADAFEMAALAVTAAVTEPEKVQPLQVIQVSVEAPVREGAAEFLLFEWLNAVIFEMDLRSMLFSRFEIRIEEGRKLHAQLWGEPVDPERHEPAVYVKGATFTALEVKGLPDGRWLAQCVVDV